MQHYHCYLRWCFSDAPLLYPCRPSQSPQFAHNNPVHGEKCSLAAGEKKKKEMAVATPCTKDGRWAGSRGGANVPLSKVPNP